MVSCKTNPFRQTELLQKCFFSFTSAVEEKTLVLEYHDLSSLYSFRVLFLPYVLFLGLVLLFIHAPIHSNFSFPCLYGNDRSTLLILQDRGGWAYWFRWVVLHGTVSTAAPSIKNIYSRCNIQSVPCVSALMKIRIWSAPGDHCVYYCVLLNQHLTNVLTRKLYLDVYSTLKRECATILNGT